MNKDSMEFVVYMIHYYANKRHVSPADVYKKLKESGCIMKYLVHAVIFRMIESC